MPTWRLVPKDPTDENWNASSWKEPVTVRAETEDRAREIADLEFMTATTPDKSNSTLLSPWIYSHLELVDCEKVNDDVGDEAILEPKGHDLEWRWFSRLGKE